MKKSIIFFVLLSNASYFVKGQSCCQKPEGMAVFASNEKFMNKHENPVAFTYLSETGKMISFKTADGKEANAFAVLCGKKTNNVLFVFHEWWGLNDYIKQEAEALQKELGNVDVYAVDLFDGQVATEREKASALMSGMKPERASAIVSGLLVYVGKDKKVANIGWCMGGSWSLQSALLAAKQAAACVMYYGFPEKDTAKLKTLQTNVLFIQATQDGFITNEVVNQFAGNLKSLGKSITVKPYDADHAFANPSNPKHNKEFTEDANKLAMDFIRKGFGL